VIIHHFPTNPHYVPDLSTGSSEDREGGWHERGDQGRGERPVLILLGLAVLWAAVLGPSVVRNRDVLLRPMSTLGATVGSTMGRSVLGAGRSLGRSGPRHLRAVRSTATSIPTDAGSARRRRRDLLATLAGLSVFTFLGGMAVGGAVWMAHFLVDLALVGYAVLVTQRHQLEAERRDTVLPFRVQGPLMGELGGASSAMRDEAVLSRRAN